MKQFSLSERILPSIVAVLLVGASAALAQLEIKAPEHFNQLKNGPSPLGAGNPLPGTQFSSVGETSASAGPISGGFPASPTAQLRKGRAGNGFATGVPRYFLGEEILPPETEADGVTPADPRYWRSKPVQREEIFNNPNGSALVDVEGLQLPNTSGSSGAPLPALAPGAFEAFYYSIHADRVFASQAGTVEIWWVSASPEGAGSGAWQFRKETFNVSGAATGAVRKIYWTEKSFDGPRVNFPGGRVRRVNPIYSANFPDRVVNEYEPVGEVANPDAEEETKTLWFEKTNGIGQLAAYNIEGRILIEYLGDETAPGKHQFLGADVVQVVRTAPATVVTVKLGHQVLPRDGDRALTGAPLDLLAADASAYYDSGVQADGRLIYYAERENFNPDQVIFYWLEDNDADIYFEAEAPGLSIRWPKHQDRYLFVWPESLDEFAHVTTDPDGSGVATGVQFDANNQPEVVFQDDGRQTESRVDIATQRLVVDLANSGDGWNRTLLKFSNGDQLWYQAVYTQTEDRDNYEEGDEFLAINEAATVGRRIERPSAKYSLAGAISGGTGYQPSAYLDPYTVGVEAAEAGAIIPVNAVPGDDVLTVRWFERIEPNPPNPAFPPFYVPSKVGRYTVSYPADLGAWSPTSPLIEERGYHTVTLLDDGKLLAVGGFSAANGYLGSCSLFDPATSAWRAVGALNTPSWGHTATRLPSGKVLVVGGNGGSAKAEVFDPGPESWTPVGALNVRRGFHRATLLADGKVLVTGGLQYTGTYAPLTSAELFDPATATWTPVGSLNEARGSHTATLLQDGRVLVAGGSNQEVGGVQIASAEIYDPDTQSWTTVAAPNEARESATATLLADGQVLLAGGRGALAEIGTFGGIDTFVPVAGSGAAQPFVFNAGTWTVDGVETGTYPVTWNSYLESPVLRVAATGPVTLTIDHSYGFENIYDGGRVLVSRNGGAFAPVPFADQANRVDSFGGVGNPGWNGTNAGTTSAQVLFNTFAGESFQVRFEAAWDVSDLGPNPNWSITSVTIDNTGYLPPTALDSAELFDPVAGTWTATASSLTDGRYQHSAILMPSGKVLVAGGRDPSGARPGGTELFDPATASWSSVSPLATGRSQHAAALLADGRVMVTGGLDLSYNYTRTVEVLEAVSQLVMASNQGTAGLTAAQAAGFIYQQNDPTGIGYNPNEEHAVKLDNKFWALRDDLNDTTAERFTSEPFVLIAYTEPTDGRPAMRPFKVRREDSRYTFNYPWTAGTRIQGPMPLPLMPLPTLEGAGGNLTVKNTEVVGDPDPAPDRSTSAETLQAYDAFTFKDRKGYKWVYRGPHAGGSPTFGMQWYYKMREEFFIPGEGAQPEVGTNLPYLRPIVGGMPDGDPVDGTALTVLYAPVWPDNPPSLRIAETLTLPKFGLPDVRNQKSAEVFYEQSVANGGNAASSVVLHDPTRNKAIALVDVGMTKLPETIRTSIYQGKTYFQGLPPHLQRRFYFNPLASSRGSLILSGEFHDEIAGEDYLDLNVLSADDAAALKDLAINEEADIKGQWESAIDGLKTRLETFIEDPIRKGTYKVDPDNTKTFDVAADELAEVPDADTARDSYALTATGQGDGYVTLVFGNGLVPDLTPPGDPPVVQIVKIVPELYNGDLKVRLSSNPLDEQVTLRHSGDFAAAPENYEFQWRHAAPTATGTQPPTYNYTRATFLGDPGDPATMAWKYLQNPGTARPSDAEYSTGDWTIGTAGRSIVINDQDYDLSSGLPGVVLKASGGVDFTFEIPANFIFSANLGDHDGFVLYVNGTVALVHANGVAALEPLLTENAYDLRLLKADNSADLPVEGEKLFVIADVKGTLHFRIFDAAGARVVDSDETQLAARSGEISALEGRLNNLWATTNLPASDKAGVVSAAAAILGFDLDTDASVGLSGTGLTKQFAVGRNYFVKGPNTVEVALYTEADLNQASQINLRLEGSTKEDLVVAGDPWQTPSGTLTNIAIVGGDATAPLGSPLLVMSDNFFTMRYRPLEGVNILRPSGSNFGDEDGWSDWTRPALVEGWIKRVLAAINPFNQRMTDLFNNAVNTDVSLLTQAGTKWEGDVALTLDAINDFGLIAIYETVLNRGKEISIDSGYNYGPANDALLLAAGYLHDLYTILGNEAFADAANPTISIDDQDTVTEVNTSRFSFEGQVASVLEEELALLRGRDDFLSPQVTQSPFYNRLFWNYTRGIDSGEALYATNYNIKEKVGSSTENGSIDAADAQRMFPQGHGDAYGHYLTALKGYYKLLTNPNYTWVPRTESLNILGNTVSVDYQDERKFAEAAANLARTAEQVVSLTHRQQYRDDPAAGWAQFRDGERGGEFNDARQWGLDEWTSRSAQGAYYHWAVGNAMLPAEKFIVSSISVSNGGAGYTSPPTVTFASGDAAASAEVENGEVVRIIVTSAGSGYPSTPEVIISGGGATVDATANAALAAKPVPIGIQQIDRGTVPELELLAVSGESFQTTLDNANAHLNPLGLSPGAIAFDIDPAEMRNGHSHYEQIHGRALSAVLNAKGSFDQAAKMTRLLRNQENQIDEFNTSIEDEERAFKYKLIDLFGSPYPGDVGPGKTYSQGYDGPDLHNWFLLDRPSNFVLDTTRTVTIDARVPVDVPNFEGFDINAVRDAGINTVVRPLTIDPDQYAQFVDMVYPNTDLGKRSITGRVQQALTDVQLAQLAITEANLRLQEVYQRFDRKSTLLQETLTYHRDLLDKKKTAQIAQSALTATFAATTILSRVKKGAAEAALYRGETNAASLPLVTGVAANDVTSAQRGILRTAGRLLYSGLSAVAGKLELAAQVAKGASDALGGEIQRSLEGLDKEGFDFEEKQLAYEFELVYWEMINQSSELGALAARLQAAAEAVRTVLAEGDRLQLEREIFRKRAATVVQGYRTNDLTFRAFRSEALEQYRTLFDLASRYTYLSAKSYDYETGLLGTAEGQKVIARIVASRALGDLSNGQPQATVSTLGDAGLAGTMAQLQADWSVAEGRLGINNPDETGTLFSMRHELFRILDDPDKTEDDAAWRQTLEQHMMSDLMSDPDAAIHCRNLRKPDGSAVPGIVIPFSTTIEHGKNFFGLPLAGGDHGFSASNFATKIYSAGVVLEGYVGMDPYAEFIPGAGEPDTNDPNALNATPYLYLIPIGMDKMLAPPLGDTGVERSWMVHDQALPLPYNLGANAFSTTQFFNANGTLTEQPWILRKHQAFRPVDDPVFFYSGLRDEFDSSRLIGRSVWNTGWKIVIPAYALLNDEQEGLDRFAKTVSDIKLFLRTYSHAGN